MKWPKTTSSIYSRRDVGRIASLSLKLLIRDSSDLKIYFVHLECPCDEFSDFPLIVSGFSLSVCNLANQSTVNDNSMEIYRV